MSRVPVAVQTVFRPGTSKRARVKGRAEANLALEEWQICEGKRGGTCGEAYNLSISAKARSAARRPPNTCDNLPPRIELTLSLSLS